MKLIVLGSSSARNGYLLLSGEGEALIIEAGCPLSEVKRALDFNISKIAAVCISHAHGDHSKYINQYLSAGLAVLSGKETFEALGVSEDINARPVMADKGYKAGSFRIMPLTAFHDIPCLGFHISHPECGNVAFFTDTILVGYSIENINTLLVEANYSDEGLEKAIEEGRTHPSQRARLLNTHMALSTLAALLRGQNIDKLNNIVLLHLSDNNSDEMAFVREIVGASGKSVYAAKKGLELDININPY